MSCSTLLHRIVHKLKICTLVGGKTAIYISHGLSSCKFCGKIAVFAEEMIKEYCTHDELADIQGGIYSEMFAAQAQYYVSQRNFIQFKSLFMRP